MSFYDEIELICKKETANHFEEVVSSFQNGNLRSATVMLYSVVICDLLYKLSDLRDIYNDSVAAKILDEVEATRKDIQQLSQWENKLIEKIHERLSLLDNDVYTNLKHLKEHRNFSAHPALNEEYELYVPSRETVASHIRNMLDGVLKKPPILAKKITQVLVTDLKNKKEIFAGDFAALKGYLEKKYFTRMSDSMFCAVFKDFWKFVYVLENDETKLCRMINHQTMQYMLERKKDLLTKLVEDDPERFSIGLLDKVTFLIMLCTVHRAFFHSLPEETKLIIEKKIDGDFLLKSLSIFLSTNATKHIQSIMKEIEDTPKLAEEIEISPNYQSKIRKWLIDEGCKSLYVDYMILLFSLSRSFDEADSRFDMLIKPSFDDFEETSFKKLIEAVNANSQINGRRRNSTDNGKIVTAILKRYDPALFDFDGYERFIFDKELLLADVEEAAYVLDDGVEELPF